MKRRTANKRQSTAKREEIDPVFKEVMSFHLGHLGIPLQTEVEVSRIPRTIDALVVLEREEERQKVRAQTPFEYFQWYNAIEFKGVRDPLTISSYSLILGRAYLYIGENNIHPAQMTVTIVCAQKPQKVLSQIRFEAVRDGVYVRHNELSVYLIVINELPIEAKNYPLLLFTSSIRKFRQFLQSTLGAEYADYIRFAYHLHPQLTKEVLTMPGKYRIPKKDLEFMAKDIGPELLPFLDPEERLRGLSLEERLRGLSLVERLRGLNSDDLRRLNAEERRAIKQLLENLDKA